MTVASCTASHPMVWRWSDLASALHDRLLGSVCDPSRSFVPERPRPSSRLHGVGAPAYPEEPLQARPLASVYPPRDPMWSRRLEMDAFTTARRRRGIPVGRVWRGWIRRALPRANSCSGLRRRTSTFQCIGSRHQSMRPSTSCFVGIFQPCRGTRGSGAAV
jgi:hypothetical protein